MAQFPFYKWYNLTKYYGCYFSILFSCLRFLTKWSEGTCAPKCVYIEISESAMILWLARYFRYSIEAIWVESTGMEAIEALTVCHVSVNEFFWVSKYQKENKTKQEVEGGEDENIKQKIKKVVIWKWFLKQIKMRKKTHDS